MAVYRFARQEEEDEILDLINLVFSQTARPHDFSEMLPKVYAYPGFSRYHAVAEEGGRLIATIAMLPLNVHMGGRALAGGYLGSVSVHKRYRGQGHMKALMGMLIREATERRWDFLALGGQRQRYGYWGFESCGGVYRFSVRQANIRHTPGMAGDDFTFVPPTAPAHWEAIARLHEKLPFRCERDSARLNDILHSYGGAPRMILDSRGGIAGYLVRMGNEITELCLHDDGDALKAVKGQIGDERSITVRVPGYLPAQAQAFRAFAETAALEDAEKLLPLNWLSILDAGLGLRAQTQNTLSDGRIFLPDGERTIQIEAAGTYRIRVENGVPQITEANGAPDLALSPRQAVETFFSPVRAALQPDPLLRAWLPLPWGLTPADTF